MGVFMFFQISVLGSFRYSPSSGSAESKGRSILNVLRDIHTVFHNAYTSVYSHQQCKGFPILHILTSTCCLLIY